MIDGGNKLSLRVTQSPPAGTSVLEKRLGSEYVSTTEFSMADILASSVRVRVLDTSVSSSLSYIFQPTLVDSDQQIAPVSFAPFFQRVNQPPDLKTKDLSVTTNTIVPITPDLISATDSDSDISRLLVSTVSGNGHIEVKIAEQWNTTTGFPYEAIQNGSVRFVSDTDFRGLATVDVTLCDQEGLCESDRVTILYSLLGISPLRFFAAWCFSCFEFRC